VYKGSAPELRDQGAPHLAMTTAAMKGAAAANDSPNDFCSHIADDVRHGVATNTFFWHSVA